MTDPVKINITQFFDMTVTRGRTTALLANLMIARRHAPEEALAIVKALEPQVLARLPVEAVGAERALCYAKEFTRLIFDYLNNRDVEGKYPPLPTLGHIDAIHELGHALVSLQVSGDPDRQAFMFRGHVISPPFNKDDGRSAIELVSGGAIAAGYLVGALHGSDLMSHQGIEGLTELADELAVLGVTGQWCCGGSSDWSKLPEMNPRAMQIIIASCILQGLVMFARGVTVQWPDGDAGYVLKLSDAVAIANGGFDGWNSLPTIPASMFDVKHQGVMQ